MDTPTSPYILVAGLGRSGCAISRVLHQKGHRVLAADSNPALTRVETELNALGILTQIGPHHPAAFEKAQMIIASPGISLDTPCLKNAAAKGVPIRGELDVAAEHITAPIVAVTGTNGKTTVTTLIDQMVRSTHAHVFTGGNIGTPLAACLEQDQEADLVVVEVSSFQLDTAQGFKPRVAILLNITPDHMDRYPSAAAYHAAKWHIFEHQNANDTAIIGSSLAHCSRELARLKGTCCFIRHAPEAAPRNGAHIGATAISFYEQGKKDPQELSLSAISLTGKHNLENIAAAALAARLTGTDTASIEGVLTRFSGLAHRMEAAGSINGVSFYNDSKATNPDAVIKALSCFDRVVLIMGGQEKNTDFSPLRSLVKEKVKHLIVMGPAQKNIRDRLSGLCDITPVNSMDDAVNTAYELAGPGDTVLLSPACASFDRYQSYGHRGNDFKLRVKQLRDHEEPH